MTVNPASHDWSALAAGLRACLALDLANSPRKMAAGVVYAAPDGRVLLLKRSGAEANYAGHWALPGGGVEAGESPSSGALRESREEIGWAPEDASDFVQMDETISPTGVGFTTYHCSLSDPLPELTLNDEHDEYGWFAPDALPEPMHPAVLRTLKGRMAKDRFALDRDTVREKDEDGHLKVKRTNISKAIVNPYYGHEIPNAESLGLDPDKIYKLLRDPKELAASAASFAGKPILIAHTPLVADDHPHDAVAGSIGDDVQFDGTYLTAPLTVWDGNAIRLIESGKQKELSCGYRYDADMTGGTFEGTAYDGVMRNIRGNHVALVEAGRAGADVVVGDSKLEHKMGKHVLSYKAAIVKGGITTYLLPKIAADAKFDLTPILAKVTAKNWKTIKPTIIADIRAGLKGKIAKDASLEDLGRLIDKFDGEGNEAVDEFPAKEDDKDEKEVVLPVPEKKDDGDDLDNLSQDADEEALRALLAGLDPEKIEQVCAMMRPKAAGAIDEPPAFLGKPKTGGKEDDVKKDDEKVSKPAMDKAIKVAEDSVIERLRASRAAEIAVRPILGAISETLAMDSAENIFKAALKAADVDIKGVHPSAYGSLVSMAVRSKDASTRAPKRDPEIAQDTANKVSQFAKDHGLSRTSVRHV